jgi:hypothetical protein
MRTRRTGSPLAIAVLVAACACAPACSDLLGIHDVGAPSDGGASEAGADASVDAGDSASGDDAHATTEAAADVGSNDGGDGARPQDAAGEPSPQQCNPGSVQTCTDATHGIFCDGTGHWSTSPQPCPQPQPDCTTAGSIPGCSCLGHVTNGTCVEPTLVAPAANAPYHVAVDATFLYWSEYPSSTCDGGGPCMDASIKRMPLAGGAIVTLAAGLPTETDFLINATGVYWNGQACPADGGACTPGLLSVPLSGGTPTLVAAGAIKGFTIDATDAYAIASAGIERIPLDGSPTSTIVSGYTPDTLVVDAMFVYWTDKVQSAVMKESLSGVGLPFVLAPNRFKPGGLAIDTSNLYWVEPGCADASGCTAVLSMPIAGNNVTQLTALPAAAGLVPFATSLYFTDFTDIWVVPIAGGPATPVVTTPNGVAANIAVDATSVYWADETGMAIRKIARP